MSRVQITADSSKRRSSAAERLRGALTEAEADVIQEKRVYVKLPAEDSHINHVVGEVQCLGVDFNCK